ncbi:MAG: hypothetical protein GY796_11610 [Chloroflexi bacterium]|nr:hypothetical protein [Chloroflexota bacterium]
MANIKKYLPLSIALLFGWLTLVGLLFNIPAITNLVLGWTSFLVAVALLLGVLNLFVVHFNRTVKRKNIYSFFLILSMLSVFTIAILDTRNITSGGLDLYFNWVQAPLEAALASLLAFFLLFAGFQLMKRQHTVWSLLFLVTAVLVLLADVLLVTSILPTRVETLFFQIQDVIRNVIVLAGVRGLLLGVALGTVTLAVRMLIGMERPYNNK